MYTPSGERKWTAAFLILTVAVYLVSIQSPFIYDDIDQILLNPSIRNLSSIFGLLSDHLRPSRIVVNFSYWLNWQISGSDTWSYHCLNIALHLICALQLRTLLKSVIPNHPVARLLTFAIFLLHPLQTASVTYVMGRISILECLYVLLCMNLCLRPKIPKWFLGTLLFFSAMIKESMVILPVLLLTCDFIAKRDLKIQSILRERWFYILPWISAPLWFLIVRTKYFQQQIVGFQLFPPIEYFLTQMYYLWFRLILIFLPAKQSIIHEYPHFSLDIAIAGMLGLLFVLGMIVVGWKQRKNIPTFTFFIIFFLVTLAPIGSILQFINPFAEYRLYLSNIPIFVALGFLGEWIIGALHAPQLRTLLYSGWITFFAFFTFLQNQLWSDPVRMVEHSIEQYPNSYRLQSMLGGILEDNGNFREAEKAYLESDRLNQLYASPITYRPKILLVQLYEHLERWQEARKVLEKIPITQIHKGAEISYFQHYLKILWALQDRPGFELTLQEGLKRYKKGDLLLLVDSSQ